MSDFVPSKKTANDFNNGVKYENGDAVQQGTINNLVESALYSQNTVEEGVATATSIANSANQTAQGALSQVNQVLADKTLLPDVQKNYYNLGAYDTYVSNGDGTGKITRKTGYACLDGIKQKIIGKSGAYPNTFFSNFSLSGIVNFSPNDSAIPPLKSIVPTYSYNSIGSKAFVCVGLTGLMVLAIGFPSSLNIQTVESANEYLRNNPLLIIEYEVVSKYQYEEKVIENQPIHIANQEECLYWSKEWRKGLNLLSIPAQSRTINGVTATIDNSGIITLSGTASSNGYINFVIKKIEAGYNYTIVNNLDVRLGLDNENGSTVIQALANSKNTAFANDDSVQLWINILSGTTYNTTGGVMLTKGSVPSQYEAYHGAILHEKDLSEIQIFKSGVNPAQTIGGDWEDLGAIQTDDNIQVFLYRRL